MVVAFCSRRVVFGSEELDRNLGPAEETVPSVPCPRARGGREASGHPWRRGGAILALCFAPLILTCCTEVTAGGVFIATPLLSAGEEFCFQIALRSPRSPRGAVRSQASLVLHREAFVEV